jgi:hypothetical protein
MFPNTFSFSVAVPLPIHYFPATVVVEEEFPELSNGERFSKIKEMWKKHKEDKKKEAS